MNRRHFLALSTLALSTTAWADGDEYVEFTREAYEEALASGEPFMLDFFAPW